MKLRELLGAHMVIGLRGHTLTDDERKFLVTENIGGVILFSRNVHSPKQVYELCAEVQSLHAQTASKSPFFISVDMEGGRVARFKEPFTLWPPLATLGRLDSPNATFSFTLALGRELRSVGINLDFAPCLDIFTNPKNTVIGDRAISDNAEIVAKHASALVRGFLKADVIPCGKHFPGHGNTLIDSHLDLPIEEASLARLESVELLPFKKAFKSGLEMVMSAHIMFPKIDPEWPATLSEIFLKQILREKLGYDGLVMSDDLDMKALAKNYELTQIPVRALQAGVDILLYCNEHDSPPRALDSLEKAVKDGVLKEADLDSSFERIQDFKERQLKAPVMPTEIIGDNWQSPQLHRDMAQAFREGRLPENLAQA